MKIPSFQSKSSSGGASGSSTGFGSGSFNLRNLSKLMLPPLGHSLSQSTSGTDERVVSPLDSRYRCWETFMVILVAYSAWVYPFEVAFMEASPKGGLEVADMVVDIFFAVDIALTFFVAYIDSRTQLLVRDRKRITFRYLSTFFIMDVASTIPYQGIAYLVNGEVREGMVYSLLGLLRLWRLRKVKQFFTRLEKDIRFSYFWVRCARLIAVTLFLVHCAGCLYYMLADRYPDRDKTWIGAVIPNFRQESLWIRYISSIYWSITTMTTVGYGDLVPSSDAGKLLASAFAFGGVAVVGTSLSKSADYLVEKQESLVFRAVHANGKHPARELRAMEMNKTWYKLYASGALLAASVASGTVVLWKGEGMRPVDALYCVCATVTTLGYGDRSFDSAGGRAFAAVWVTVSTAVVALFFLYVAELYAERRQRALARWVLTRRTTNTDLEAADLDGDRRVGAAEFVLYKLKELGKISQEEISEFMEEFDELDADHNGTLSPSDLAIAQATI